MTMSSLRHRPIYGGPFGMGRYSLATMPCVINGLHAVRFMVIEPVTGAVLSVAEEKTRALDAARAIIQVTHEVSSSGEDAATFSGQASLWPMEDLPITPTPPRRRPVSRRRRDIFAKCAGRCHYCRETLELGGPWHIEHMLPRALGGLDEIGNLVAACASCNLAKSDHTALEFVLRRLPGADPA